MAMMILSPDKKQKYFRSPTYNFDFDMKTGFFARWGEVKENDPPFCPYGPELLDIEIASGYCDGGCPWCYKGNSIIQDTKYMSFDTYRVLFDKINVAPLTQIAFGITSIGANPDIWKIMEYTRDHDIIPNYTTNGLNMIEEDFQKTKKLCGAVAVSVYPHTAHRAYKTIRRFLDSGMDQVNIHFMLCKETLDFAYEVVNDSLNDPLLKGLHAIVFLQYKDKSHNAKFHQPSFDEFKKLVDYCLEKKIGFGFDSCSSAMFMKSVADNKDTDSLIQSVDNCESSLMSFYINVDGVAYPCSFLEGVNDWKEGINVLHIEDFLKDVWYSTKVKEYRNRLLGSSKNCICKFSGSCRSCFVYDINDCKEN
jgi:MoaA/NifB/PqqE/SkfB family radical SAM enzyme